MNKRRNFLIMSSVMLLVPGITTLYHLMKKIVVNGENRTAGLSNSIWLPNWRMQKSLVSALNALQKECVKTVSPFWYEINNRGILIAKPGSDGLYIPDKATIDLLKKNGASVIPAITTTLMPEDFIRIFSAQSAQQRLAEAIRQEVMTNSYDGIELDLEYIALTTDIPTAKKVRDIYTDLCRCISSALSFVNKILIITVMPRWSDGYEVWRDKLMPAVYDYKTLSGIASVLRVMAYDQHAPGSPPGPVAGFEWVKHICHWTRINVCCTDKVEIGIPLYGRDWGGGKVKEVIYDNVVQLRKMYPKSEVIYSETGREETFAYVSTAGDRHEVWYSNNQSVTDRLALICSYGFRGGAFWAASYENPTLWDAVRVTP
ncbi:TPA: hypothetical protein R4C62_004613 [Salmonella enterica subsp. enterica serovar Oranienburg]|nr:hypothetical protein [Salmonella enterica]HEC8685155.1 hypothetical protein [Salmonella enterica subsp. enterica serovar Oranienburg]HEC9416613.1 hypothetical protein [Salmonella enterica subsp. enterica serovar Poona]